MDVRERIRISRLIETISRNAEYAERIGITTFNAGLSDIGLPVVTENANQEGAHKGE